MNQCPNCGVTDIPVSAKFCPGCGTPIVVVQQQAVPPQQAAPPQPAVPTVPIVPPQPVVPQPQVVRPPQTPSPTSSSGVKPLATKRKFEDVAKHDKPKGRSIVSRILLLVCSIVGLYAFTIPFFEIFIKGHKTLVSGLDVVKAGLNKTGFWAYPSGNEVITFISDMLSSFHGPEKIFKLGGILVVTVGPAIFGLMFFMYFISALRGRRYTSGFTFSIVYTVMSGVIFFVAGMEIGVKIIIFQHLAAGYWITIVALFGAKMSSRIH